MSFLEFNYAYGSYTARLLLLCLFLALVWPGVWGEVFPWFWMGALALIYLGTFAYSIVRVRRAMAIAFAATLAIVVAMHFTNDSSFSDLAFLKVWVLGALFGSAIWNDDPNGVFR